VSIVLIVAAGHCMIYFLGLLYGFISMAHAACIVLGPAGKPVHQFTDSLSIVLHAAKQCPKDVFELRELLLSSGLTFETALVANRGFHNPKLGSFSMFETATGTLKNQNFNVAQAELFFGHFTAPIDAETLSADQNTEASSLMIEAFAWDSKKEFYNFYELRGTGKGSQWFYRGDSADIIADNKFLHRQADPDKPVFGTNLRCSACHAAGGPILKELDSPHNDWWEPNRGLDFGGRMPDQKLEEIFKTLVPAERLASSVLRGLKKLDRSKPFQKFKSAFSFQERLRPLFCPVEVNFQSDHEAVNAKAKRLRVPAEFFAEQRLLITTIQGSGEGVKIDRALYDQALSTLKSRFPETDLPDADHSFLAPVKAKSDQIAVNKLIEEGTVDEEFVLDVLAVDFTNPVFSQARCELLKLIPNDANPDWNKTLLENLHQSALPAAKELAENLNDSKRHGAYHLKQAKAFIEQCTEKFQKLDNVIKLVQLLDQRRNEVKASEISKNPRGQILEPGFRVIFPELAKTIAPATMVLTKDCDIK